MKKISLNGKRWLISLHLFFVAVMLGVTVVFLILSIIAAGTKDSVLLNACYTSMHLLAKSSIRASTIGTVTTGVLLSILTNWGLFKYRWIIVKEILTIACIGIGIFGMYFWTLEAASITSVQGKNALTNPDFAINHLQLMTGIILQIISLAAMTVISVFKPWGKVKGASI